MEVRNGTVKVDIDIGMGGKISVERPQKKKIKSRGGWLYMQN